MESRAQGNPVVSTSTSQSAVPREKCPRSVWIMTAYGVSGLALFGVLAYYFASYVAH
jgi:hypothetical protein